jgi:hypothetical protein
MIDRGGFPSQRHLAGLPSVGSRGLILGLRAGRVRTLKPAQSWTRIGRGADIGSVSPTVTDRRSGKQPIDIEQGLIDRIDVTLQALEQPGK